MSKYVDIEWLKSHLYTNNEGLKDAIFKWLEYAPSVETAGVICTESESITNGFLNGFLRRLSVEENKLKDTIKSITFNKKKGITTVVFNDGDVQMSKCSDKDVFDEAVGVALCIATHLAGSKTKFKKFIAEHVKEIKK